MKPVAIFLCIFFCCTTIHAQHYQSIFGKNSTSWTFVWGNLWGDVVDSAYVQKDTLVNGYVYKKVVCGSSWFHGGLLREDTLLGSVWYRSVDDYGSWPGDTIERLAFRFDLDKDSTFLIDNVYYQGTDTVDSVRTIGGLKYIYFKKKLYGFEPFTIIEGVGCNLGILFKEVATVMQAQYLLCSYKDGIKTSYSNLGYSGECHPATNIVNQIAEKEQLSLFPNPASDVIQISNKSNYAITHAQVIDATGRTLLDIREPNIKSLSLNPIPPGVFIIRLFTNNEPILLKPLIIQR